jgi:hypothetical protein
VGKGFAVRFRIGQRRAVDNELELSLLMNAPEDADEGSWQGGGIRVGHGRW